MNRLTARMWGAARSLPSLGNLIDKFLDWVENTSVATAPAAIDGLVCNVEARLLLD